MTKKKKIKKSVVVTVIIIIAIAALMFAYDFYSNIPKSEDSVVAVANGRTVFLSEINERLEQISPDQRGDSNRLILINQTITQKLLEAEVEKAGIDFSREDVQILFDNMLIENGVSEEEFAEYAASMNMGKEEFLNNFEKSLELQEFIENILTKDIEVSEEELKDFYDLNEDYFSTKEQRNVSHILICYEGVDRCEQDRSKEEAMALVEEVKSKITKNNFGELAKEYSDGPSGPNEGSLGYMDADTGFVPEFKEAALELKENSVSDAIETVFGYHLIKVYDIKEANILEFDDVKEGLEQEILTQRKDELVMQFIESLNLNAEIKTYEFKNACDEEKIYYTDTFETKEGYLVVEKAENDLVSNCFGNVEVGKYICNGKVKSSC